MSEIEDIINSLEKPKIINKKPKKRKNKLVKVKKIDENRFIKETIKISREKKEPIEALEFAQRFGYHKDDVLKSLKELDEEERIASLPKPVKPKISDKLKRKYGEIKILDSADKDTLKEIFMEIVLYGIPINFALMIVTKGFFIFNFYNWIGWGIAFWFTHKEVGPFLRGIIHK